ncbi:HTH-type transcriptional activator HxlR [Hyella patelloides LEGE 07179]|uniref:HTH-type transcriptional activator HxlR n=1 Tax=Hyella patelloides LEGE 07179 TaxID=945734 RepID=A0A563VZF0_9CYAN|nr:helix-turn-helix domain-containing protein [Hyella patelloides]VEP16842.1 HTH-type transcriptional activator HxlR [Hyella patelloides LEGE 07179]
MVRGEKDSDCPVESAVKVLSGKWKILILWELRETPKRFAELRRGVTGITEKMLIQQLKELEKDRIIHRKDFHEMPPKVEYSLTERGRKLKPVFDALWKWGREQIQESS